jgi:hypothetical protein
MQMQQATSVRFDTLKVRVPRAWTEAIKSAAQSEAETVAGCLRRVIRKEFQLPKNGKTND